jgi:hypothetical protein
MGDVIELFSAQKQAALALREIADKLAQPFYQSKTASTLITN